MGKLQSITFSDDLHSEILKYSEKNGLSFSKAVALLARKGLQEDQKAKYYEKAYREEVERGRMILEMTYKRDEIMNGVFSRLFTGVDEKSIDVVVKDYLGMGEFIKMMQELVEEKRIKEKQEKAGKEE